MTDTPNNTPEITHDTVRILLKYTDEKNWLKVGSFNGLQGELIMLAPYIAREYLKLHEENQQLQQDKIDLANGSNQWAAEASKLHEQYTALNQNMDSVRQTNEAMSKKLKVQQMQVDLAEAAVDECRGDCKELQEENQRLRVALESIKKELSGGENREYIFEMAIDALKEPKT